MKATSRIATKSVIQNGQTSLMKSSIFTFVIVAVVNITVPIGGVIVPTLRQRIKNKPKWTGSIWYTSSIGIKIGVKMTNKMLPSTSMPTISKNIIAKIRKAAGLLMNSVTQSVKACGICSSVRIQPKALPAAIIIIIDAVRLTDSFNASNSCLPLIFR